MTTSSVITVAQTTKITSAGRGWSIGQLQSSVGRLGRTLRAGRTPANSAQTSTTVATTASNSVSTISVGARVVYVVPGSSALTRTSFTTSPERAGATALTPVPAKYAPVT